MTVNYADKVIIFHENKPNDNKGNIKTLKVLLQQLFGPLHH